MFATQKYNETQMMMVVNELLPPTLQLFSQSAYNQGKKTPADSAITLIQYNQSLSMC